MIRMFPLMLMMFLVAFASSAAFGQIKEITEEEYQSASSAAWAKTKSSYPFITTETFISDGNGRRKVVTSYESMGRLYRKSTITSYTGIKVVETVEYDGEIVYRADGGIWTSLERPKWFSGPAPRPSNLTYMLEQITKDGKVFKRYLQGRSTDGYFFSFSSFKINESGQVIETAGIALPGTIYEYPRTLTPITKPKIGSKEDI